MSLGALLILIYWSVFTLRRGFTPKVLQQAKAAKYDINHGGNEARKAARNLKLLLMVAWILRVGIWVENALLVLLTAWLAFLVGALVAGNFVVFGYPV